MLFSDQASCNQEMLLSSLIKTIFLISLILKKLCMIQS